MTAGHTHVVASKASCNRAYWAARTTQLYWTMQNTWRYPTGQQYVSALIKEEPLAHSALVGKVAVITNVSPKSSSYHVAEELAVAAGMELILLGKSYKRLKEVEKDLHRALYHRKSEVQRKPKIHKLPLDQNDLHSVLQASAAIQEIVKEHYQEQGIAVLIHNPSGVTTGYDTTTQGVEINMGRNFVSPFVLTEKLLPLLQQAATERFKPRLVFVSSIGHCQGTDFDPQRLMQNPGEGGAPEGVFEEKDDCRDEGQQQDISTNNDKNDHTPHKTTTSKTKAYVENELDGGVIMYYRSRMAIMANALALAKAYPQIMPVSVYPGSVASNSKSKSLGIAETFYQTGFYYFQLSPQQASRATLRAVLDPDFNDPGKFPKGGVYLHCDGNPWVMADPTLENPAMPEQPYSLEGYAALVRRCTKDLCSQLLANLDKNATPKATTQTAEAQDNDGDDEEIGQLYDDESMKPIETVL